MKTLVAFANGSGGIVLIGVEDQTRHVVGIPDPTGLESQLASWIVDRIEPRLVPEIRILPWRKKNILLVEVFPSPLRPHYLKSEGNERGVYVRVGSTNRRADPAQVDEIRRQVSGRSFDEDPLPEMNSEDIDFLAASQFFSPLRKLSRGDLKPLALLVRYQNREVPTVGAILLFGKNRLSAFPDAHLRAGVFAGTDRTRILDSQEIRSYLPGAVEEAITFIQRNTRRAIRIHGTRNEGIPEFPLIALREAVINAIVHADYAQRGSPLRLAIFSDRIEIENPGGLPPGLTLDELRQGVSKLRNRVIGRVFHELGLIEQWGSGIQRMTKACLEAGLPDPVFEEIGAGFRVTFGLIPIRKPKLESIDQNILALLKGTSGLSTSRIATAIQRTPKTARERIKRLIGLGLIMEYGSSPQDPKKVFRLFDKSI
jgi:predicted HTH transcriptional regulator